MGLAKAFSNLTRKEKVRKQKQPQPVGSSQFDDDDVPMWYDRGKATMRDKILLDRRLRFFVVMFFAAVVVPVVVYICYFQDQHFQESQQQTCLVKDDYRVPCFPGQNVSQTTCEQADCCFNTTTGECHHMLPSSYGFNIESWSNSSEVSVTTALSSRLILTALRATTAFGSQYTTSKQFALSIESSSHLKISLADSNIDVSSNKSNHDLNNTDFSVTIYGPKFFFDIYRRLPDGSSNGPLILTTSRGPIISSEDYSEITLEFSPNSAIYGLGGIQPHAKKGSPRTLYNSRNQTGSHPIFISLDEHGYFQGVFVENSGPMEVEVYDNSNLVVLRTLLSTELNIHIFSGPTAGNVMDQLSNVIGKPNLPPYWALGFHICPNLDDDDVCLNFTYFMGNASAIALPWDSHCLDDSLLVNRLLFNTGRGCESNSPVWNDDELTKRTLLLTLPVPAPSNSTTADGPFLTYSGSNYEGQYKLQSVAYPDFSAASSEQWLKDHVSAMITDIPKDRIGGYVLLNNWPEEDYRERPGENLDYLPQAVNGSLSNGTVWWQAQHVNNVSHVHLHNVYGLQQTQRLASSMSENSVLLSTASYPGLGTTGGCHAHPTADVQASWATLKEALSNMIGLGLSGITLAGSPICGNDPSFDRDSDEELCIRWYQLAALSPLMRVSSGAKFRDPLSFPNSTLFRIKRAIELRYKLLPYLYTHFEEASRSGMPVVRPMSFEFPLDNGTWNLQSQYMLGTSLLVAPVLDGGVVSLPVYLPEGNGTWYFLEGGHGVNNGTGGYMITLSVTPVQAILLLRPGSALFMHEGGLSSSEALAGNYSLAIGLLCDQDAGSCSAQASLTLPEMPRKQIDITANSTSLTIANMENLHHTVALNSLQVYGLSLSHGEILLPVTISALPDCSNYATSSAQYEMETQVMFIEDFQLNNCNGTVTTLVVSW